MSSRIYAAEDDDNIREILRCTLESYGYEVEVFESAPPMLERMRRQLPDLVLMDIMMPELDGLEALRRMKESAQTRNVPVIFLTAKSSEVDKVRGLDLGAEDYITKPFGLLELAARVRAALRRQPVEHRDVYKRQVRRQGPCPRQPEAGDQYPCRYRRRPDFPGARSGRPGHQQRPGRRCGSYRHSTARPAVRA